MKEIINDNDYYFYKIIYYVFMPIG